jgi:hypothetical protein
MERAILGALLETRFEQKVGGYWPIDVGQNQGARQ